MKDRDCEQCGREIRLHDESPLVLCGYCQQVVDLKARIEQLRTERNARYEDWVIAETARVNAVAEVERLQDVVEDLKTELLGRVDKNVKLVEQHAEVELLRPMLQRVRDWMKYAANSEGGIVREIDNVLEAKAAEPTEE